MKKSDFSLLELFQDPLFTMIAIVLMGTVWVIIPGKSTPVDPKVYVTQDEIHSLKREVGLKEENIKQLQTEVQRLKEEIGRLESTISAKSELDEGKYGKNLEEINQKINEIKNELERKREELKLLEDELKKAKEGLDRAKKKEDIELILARIKQLEKEIEKKREDLGRLEEIIRKVWQERERAKEHGDKQKNLIAHLQRELKTKLEAIKKLEKELEEFKDDEKPGIMIKGIEETKKEEDVVFQLINNRLFPVDDEHFNVETVYLKMEGGQTVRAVKRTRKSYVKGENIDEIQKPDSKFQKTLKKLNSTKVRICFDLHNDSFEIFRKAREIVQNSNFEMTWRPTLQEEIIFTSGIGRVKSTDIQRK